MDNMQNSNIGFWNNWLLTGSSKAMGRYKNPLLLADIIWSTQNNLPKNDRYSDSSTDWTVVSLNFF